MLSSFTSCNTENIIHVYRTPMQEHEKWKTITTKNKKEETLQWQRSTKQKMMLSYLNMHWLHTELTHMIILL